MTDLTVNGRAIPLDRDGYLVDLNDWTPDVAEALADREGIRLSPPHWEILLGLRDFYAQYSVSPSMRPLSKHLKQTLGEAKSRSIYLLSLFPGSPPKLGAKIAGLPRPANCL